MMIEVYPRSLLELEARFSTEEACHQTVTNVSVHKDARPLKNDPIAMRLVLKQRLYPLSVNIGSPLCVKHVHDGELH